MHNRPPRTGFGGVSYTTTDVAHINNDGSCHVEELRNLNPAHALELGFWLCRVYGVVKLPPLS